MKVKFFILISFFVTTFAQAEPLPEFVSLTQEANFEKGQLEWRGNTFLINKIAEGDALELNGEDVFFLELTLAENESELAAIVISTEDGTTPDGKFAGIVDSGITYIAEQLSASEESSQMIIDHSVIVFNGNFVGNNESVSATITITESLIGGGSSEIQIEGNNVYLNGTLGTRTYNQIFQLIAENPEVNTIVEVDVSGSVNDDINVQTGRLIRQAGMDTYVPGNGSIASGGVDLFSAGVNRTIEFGATIGVHSWSDGNTQASDLPEDSPLHNDQIAYFNEMLGSSLGRDFYFFTINAAPADSIHNMSQEEITRWQLGVSSENTLGLSQCAAFNSSALPQVDIPCVKTGNEVFNAGLNQVDQSIFELAPSSLEKLEQVPSQHCSTFVATENKLQVPCLKIDETTYSAILEWVNSSPIQFKLIDFEIKP